MSTKTTPRFKKYIGRQFAKRYTEIDNIVNRDSMFPKDMESCFSKVGLNPDLSADTLAMLIEDAVKDKDNGVSFITLCKFLVSIGYLLGKEGRRHEQRTKQSSTGKI
jgi:hypothetical protein